MFRRRKETMKSRWKLEVGFFGEDPPHLHSNTVQRVLLSEYMKDA
jgi:hypothetical protein